MRACICVRPVTTGEECDYCDAPEAGPYGRGAEAQVGESVRVREAENDGAMEQT